MLLDGVSDSKATTWEKFIYSLTRKTSPFRKLSHHNVILVCFRLMVFYVIAENIKYAEVMHGDYQC